MRHVVYFASGMLLSLAWNVPATWAVIRYAAATAPRPVVPAPVHVLPGVLMFLCLLGLSAFQLARELRHVRSSVSHCVTSRHARSLAAGLCTGVFGAGPLFLFGLWSQLTGWGVRQVGIPRLAVGLLVIFWCSVCLTVPGLLAARLVTARRPGTGVCANCGYDLRATPDRCPECGLAAVPAIERRSVMRLPQRLTALFVGGARTREALMRPTARLLLLGFAGGLVLMGAAVAAVALFGLVGGIALGTALSSVQAVLRWSGVSERFVEPLSLLIAAVLPGALGLILMSHLDAARRRRDADRRGCPCCAACGYDLRATPARCPECGTVSARGQKPPHNPPMHRTGAAGIFSGIRKWFGGPGR